MALKSSSSLFLVFFACLFCSSFAYQFNVGGKYGWVTNPSENYNHWAGRMRFQVNDTLFFKYRKGSDSVLVVKKDDYDNCETDNPILKMDDGNSIFKFDRSGPFYFISGNKENCEKGQKIIIVVLAVRNKQNPPAVIPPQAPAPAGQAPAPAIQAPVAEPPKGSTPFSPSPATTPGSPAPAVQAPVAEPPKGSTPFSPSPATTPGSPAPAANSPAASSPVPALSPLPPSPTSHSPATAPTPVVGPTAPAPATHGGPVASPVGSPAPAAGNEAPSLAPSSEIEPPTSSATPGSPTATPAGSSAPTAGNTPADINSPAGSSAVSAFTPTVMLMSTVSLVISVTLGGFTFSF